MLKVSTFIYRHLQGNLNCSGLEFKVAYWPAQAVGGAAHLVAAHCLNKRTLDRQSAARQAHPYHAMAVTPQCSSEMTDFFY